MKLIITAIITLLPAFSFATGATETLASFIGKTGVYSEFGRKGSVCSVQINMENQLIAINGSGSYQNGDAVEDSAELVVDSSDQKVFQSKANGKRQGGDECGDFGGMFNYKKQLIVNLKDQRVSIVSTFRCLTEGGKKTILDYSCQF